MEVNKSSVADLLSEGLIDLRRACAEPPLRNARTGKPCHVSQTYRYAMRGATAANGERIRLETILTPSGRRTSREAVVRFIARLTDPDQPISAPRARVRQIKSAEADLEAAGFEVGGE